MKPRFEVYKAVSQQIREIFAEHTRIIEPLSLDEAYLDVTEKSAEHSVSPGRRVRDPSEDKGGNRPQTVLVSIFSNGGLR